MTVVVGYVPTPEGRAALERGVAEARLRGTRVVVVNSKKGGPDESIHDAARSRQDLERVGAELETEGVDHEVRQLVLGNDPPDDLMAVANEVGAELIVIGLRQRSTLGKLLLGSSAERILLEADCPVLAVKPR